MSFPIESSLEGALRTDGTDPGLLRAWVELQASYALYPQVATDALRKAGDPRSALALVARRKPDAAACVKMPIDRQLALLRRDAVQVLPILAPGYPSNLARLVDAPALLFVRGRIEALQGPGVAIVGARAVTGYGKEVAFELGRALAAAGLVIVSGLARGVDAAAHRGALDAGGMTVAVQACGPDTVYPAEHRELATAICERGSLVTEFPPGALPRRFHFPLRNRLISGLSRVVIVVEARERSGSLITAEHALEQGVDLMAVPGPITSPASAGPNRLLREGAAPVLEPADVLQVLGLDDVGWESRSEGPEPGHLAEGTRALWRALAESPGSREELGERLGRAPEQIALALVELQLEGRVAEDRDGRFRRARSSR